MREIKCEALFLNEFKKFNNTGARMLDYIYHMTLKLLKNHILGAKSVKILLSFLSLKKLS